MPELKFSKANYCRISSAHTCSIFHIQLHYNLLFKSNALKRQFYTLSTSLQMAH